MSQLALITPIGADMPGVGGGPIVRPPIALPPIALPPLPPGVVAPPIALPPTGEHPANPIVIPNPPDKPMPPGVVWPPLNPGDGIYGESIVLVWVVGTDKYRWVAIKPSGIWPPQPK